MFVVFRLPHPISLYFNFNYMKTSYSCITAVLIIVCLMTGACSRRSNRTAENASFNVLTNDTIEIAEGSNLIGKIECDEVCLTPYAATITTTGVISPIPTEYAEIAAPLPGRIVKSHIKIGLTVKQGSPPVGVARREPGKTHSPRTYSGSRTIARCLA